jgi:predicted RNA binding protein with dsRBD fold (UPF0201 family)
MVEVIVEAEVKPTEDIEKVKRAVLNVVKLSELEVEEVAVGFRVIRVKCVGVECLEPFRAMIKAQQIEPAVRSHLEKCLRGGRIEILLHKQACYVGKVSLIDSERESPLGPVKVTVVGNEEELKRVVDYLTSEE